MSERPAEPEESAPDYHLLLDPEEVPVTASALRLYLGDEAHQPEIQALGREVLAGLEGTPGERDVLSVPLTAQADEDHVLRRCGC